MDNSGLIDQLERRIVESPTNYLVEAGIHNPIQTTAMHEHQVQPSCAR
jgi:hypothetical protein